MKEGVQAARAFLEAPLYELLSSAFRPNISFQDIYAKVCMFALIKLFVYLFEVDGEIEKGLSLPKRGVRRVDASASLPCFTGNPAFFKLTRPLHQHTSPTIFKNMRIHSSPGAYHPNLWISYSLQIACILQETDRLFHPTNPPALSYTS
jgi:hypothetical protein